MLSRNSAMKRRRRKITGNKAMYRGPETERRLAFMLAHQLHLQDTQQPRPFPETTLGRLPGEIREMIYEYLLVYPPSQSTIYLRVPLIAATKSDMTPAKEATSEAASTEPPQVAPVQYLRSAKVSYLAILQTCRQINREAYHIFYARNSFHFSNAEYLIAFLRGIGPVRRAELTSLHLEGLVVDQPLWRKNILDRYCLGSNIGSVERERREAQRCLVVHPDIYGASKLLDDCKNLSRLLLEMRTCERPSYFFFLKWNLGEGRRVVYLVDGSRWVVRWPCKEQDEDFSGKDDTPDKWWAYTACYPTQDPERLFSVVVDIIRGPEEALGKGYQSWVAFR